MRLRLTFAKTEAMRFTSHLDLYRTWERTLRRAGLPLAYTQGFSPHPRINLGAALPLGFTSECELVDIWLEAELEPGEIERRLKLALPPGIQVLDIQIAPDRAPALQTQIESAIYHLTLLEPAPDLPAGIQRLLQASALPRQRRGKAYDLRPLILALQPLPPERELHCFLAHLRVGEKATGRPEEVLDELGIPAHTVRIHRQSLILRALDRE